MAEEEVIEIDLSQLKKMKVQELRKQAAELGLESKGTKAELLVRVEKYLKEQEEDLLEEEGEEEEAADEEEGEVEEGEAEEGEVEEGEEKGAPAEPELEPATVTPLPEEKTTPPAVSAPEIPSEAPPQKLVKLSNTTSTPEERVLQRTERFGVNSSEETKKLARAKRFRSTLDNVQGKTSVSGDDLEKFQKRTARFGSAVAPILTAAENEQKKLKRRERFGMATTDLPLDDRKRKRLERFGAS